MAGSRWSCLMYHAIPGLHAPSGSAGYFAVPRVQFGRQLDLMRDQGLRVTSMETVAADPSQSAVALTFDDADITQYAEALPELVQRGMSATIFVVTDWVGRTGFVSWSQLGELVTAGISIQSHTHTHPFLSELSPAAVADEVGRSKGMLEERLGIRVQSLALPGGDMPGRAGRTAIRAAGYDWLATSVWGPNRALQPGALGLVRRYTVRAATPTSRLMALAQARSPSYDYEGVRLRALTLLRSTLGPTRYSRWRRLVLDRGRTAHAAE